MLREQPFLDFPPLPFFLSPAALDLLAPRRFADDAVAEGDKRGDFANALFGRKLASQLLTPRLVRRDASRSGSKKVGFVSSVFMQFLAASSGG